MPQSALITAGAAVEPSKYSAIYVDTFFTGLWTNSSPLRDAAVPYVYRKLYSASRFDRIIDGQNVEISQRLTPIRRPGNSVYNSQTFAAINDFYSFHVFNTRTFTEVIKVIADTATSVYDATGPSTKSLIFTKAAGSSQTSFQSVGNILYMADGVDQKQWVVADPWGANVTYSVGDRVVDTNGNIQEMVGGALLKDDGTLDPLAFVTVSSNVLTIEFTAITLARCLGYIGFNMVFAGIATANFLSEGVYNITSTGNSNFEFIGNINHPDYPRTAEAFVNPIFTTRDTGLSGSVAPTWNTIDTGLTVDNFVCWKNRGPHVIDWQPIGPQQAPVVSNVINTQSYAVWAANTYFNPNLQLIDSNGNVQQLTTGGQTGGVQPVWNVVVGGATADNTAVWTNQGSATRSTLHAYNLNNVIQVTFYVTRIVNGIDPNTGERGPHEIIIGPFTDVFKCTTPGTSSATATGSLNWTTGIGSTVVDGSVTWTNTGKGITWATIGANTLVSLVTQILDTNGNLQNIATGGKSGGVAPTWSTTVGATTPDGTAFWVNAGPATAANTSFWVYGYAYKNSTTGAISECSPKSDQIVLASGNLISVSGNGDPNWATDGTDTIQIYRSVQGQTTLFLLAELRAPFNGAPWSYFDNTPDPPNPASTLNEFISADVSGINSPPPAGITNLAYYLSRVWGTVGALVYYSSSPQQSIGVNTDNWPGENFFQFPSVVTKLFPTTSGMIFFTNQGLFISSGIDGNGNPSQPVPFLQDIGLLSPNAFSVNGTNPLLLTSDRQFLFLDPSSGASRAGFPIEDQLQAFDPASSYVTWHTNGPDQAAYVANGVDTWFRVNLTPAPETGSYSWSPKGVLAAGVKCLKSIETTPGHKELLLGPSSSGPILKRDATINNDNGATYPAFFTIGGVVLAQPGTAVEVAYIATCCKRIGSDVSPAIIANEIGGAFETFPLATLDPPWLPASSTLYSDRWYFDALQTPSWFQSCQIKFTWPAEDAANEMLYYAPVASLHIDDGSNV